MIQLAKSSNQEVEFQQVANIYSAEVPHLTETDNWDRFALFPLISV